MADNGRREKARPWWLKVTRDRVLFAVGLAGIAHETLRLEVAERPMLLLAFLAMVGLPSFLPETKR